MAQGSIESLEIAVPWSELLSGRVSVLISGLKFTVDPLKASAQRRSVDEDQDHLSASLVHIAESFVEDDLPEQTGVGSDDVPSSAILQRLLETILMNLKVEISRLEVVLKGPESASSISLTVERMKYGPVPSTSNKMLEASRLEVKLLRTGLDESRRINNTRHTSESTSSRSTSSSSFDDAELMQSTIFGRQEGRSLYMSAISSPSMYHSAIAEESDEVYQEDEESSSETDSLLASCTNGFTVLLTQAEEGALLVDISCQDIEILAGRSQIRHLCGLVSLYSLSKTEPKEAVSSPRRPRVNFRLSRLQCDLDLNRDNDLNVKLQPIADLPSFSISMKSLSLLLDSEEISCKVREADFQIGNSSLLHDTELKENFLELHWKSSSSAEVTLRPLALRADLATLLLHWNSALELVQVITKESSRDCYAHHGSNISRDFFGQICCSSLRMECMVGIHPIVISLGGVVVSLTTSITKSRLLFEFESILCSICDSTVLQDDNEASHILDLTMISERPVQRTLEFINYEELFENSERDHKSASSTLQALKQRAKEASSKMFRASIGSLFIRLDERKLILLGQIAETVQRLCMPTSMAVGPDHFSTDKSINVVMYLAEVKACRVVMDAGEHTFELRATGCTSFAVTNLKNIDAACVDVRHLSIIAVDKQDVSTKILSGGIHLNETPPSRTLPPMVSVRGRRNRSGLLSGTYMCRLGLTDTHFEYFVEMCWIDTLRSFFTSSSMSAPRQTSTGTSSPSQPRLSLAIDLVNVSIGLNPYTSAAKGLLYFRNSAIRTDSIQRLPTKSVKLHAGVIDVFLIDDIEGGQNDLSNSKRVQKDPVASALIKLGFVHVAGVETVEIGINVEQPVNADICYTVDISGAILTLTTCPDSTATLIALVNSLRLPIILSDELKYKLGLTSEGEIPIDVLGNIEEDAFRNIQNALGVSATKSLSKSAAKSKTLESELLGDLGQVSHNKDDLTKVSFPRETNETVLVVDEEEDEDMLALVDEHFLSTSVLEFRQKRSTESTRPSQSFIRIESRNCFAVWNLHDGYDWDKTRQEIVRAVDTAVAKAHKARKQEWSRTATDEQDEEDDNSSSTDSNEIGDLLFNSIYISLPSGARSEDVTKSINLELAQARLSDTNSQTTATIRPRTVDSTGDHEHSLRLGRSKVHKVRIELSGICAAFEVLSAGEGEVLNHLDLTVRDLEVIDNVSTSTWRKFMTYHRGAGPREKGSNMADVSVSTIKPVAGLAAAELVIKAAIAPLRLHVDQDTLEFLTRFFEFRDINSLPPAVPADEIFIQRFELQAIAVQIDYKPKRVDYKGLRSGRTTEFKNFFILEDSNMVLKHVILYGVCGFARVFQYLNDIWLAHIKSSQLGSVLAGVSPLRSIASFGGGLKNLVTIPIAEYQKDGRFVPGLRKGLSAFARSTGSEAVRLGAKLAIGTQGFLESAESLMHQNGETSRHTDTAHAVSLYANQPRDLRQGVSQAISGMTRNVVTARDVISTLPRDLEGEQDTRGAVLLAARSVPIAVIRPLIGTTEMISKTLLGLRNTMHPEQRKMNDDKYK